jgi:hypothetical protein
MGKKKKEVFQDFRNTEKSAYKTLKIPLKTILLNRDTIQPVITPFNISNADFTE